MSSVVKYVFDTNAFKVSPEDKPFWYTSGKIGPFFINTHFLYGNEEMASDLLKYIDECLENKQTLPLKVFKKVCEHYDSNKIYKNVINEMVNYLKENVNIDEIEYISGGERRDWFFSMMIANLLGKKHITLYKDLTSLITNSDFTKTEEQSNANQKKVLHIADLITTASSYENIWIPIINKMNAKMEASLVVIDRKQGGEETLQKEGVKSFSILQVDDSLFQKAFELNIINEKQLELLRKYKKNPDGTMQEFLLNHPKFIENALKADEKTAKRAQKCIDNHFYNL